MYRRLFFAPLVLAIAALATGCHAGGGPQLRVLGVKNATAPALAHEVVFVQVSNPASHAMRLTKLEYSFAADNGTTVSEGEIPLEREVPADSTVVVEVPLDTEATKPLTLRGKLTAELDQIVRIFSVSAQIQPH
jgi:LEA14-like dessication related protein